MNAYDCEECTVNVPECLGCVLGLSELELKMFADALEQQRKPMQATGLSPRVVDAVLDALRC